MGAYIYILLIQFFNLSLIISTSSTITSLNQSYPTSLIVLLIMFYNHTPKTIFIIILVLSSNHHTQHFIQSHFNINLIILSNLIFISIYSQFESVLEFRIYGQKTKVCTYMYNSTYICIYIIIFKSLCNIIFFFISINIYN